MSLEINSILKETIVRFDGTDNGYCRICRQHRLCDAKGNVQPCQNKKCFSFKLVRATKEVEVLCQWIRDEGVRNDTCTYNVLGEICTDCRCGKAD